jgi:serine/threonine protein kinase
VEGEPLMFADGSGPLPVKRVIDVLGQVADALDYIHKRGIIHGDVKADNILLVAEPGGQAGTRRRRSVRLLDFGLARRHGAHEEGVSGSPHYLAPERASGGPATVATDVYALGVLGYLMFTRSLPFEGPVVDVLMQHIHDAPEPMSKRRGEQLDDAIETLIARAMAKQAATRHASAAAFRYELNTVMDMLDMGRKRTRSSGQHARLDTRESTLAMLFETSPLPQALVSKDGVIELANRAFDQLVGDPLTGTSIGASSLANAVPSLVRSIRAVHAEGKPIEIKARVAPLELVIWLVPGLSPTNIHVLIRTDETRNMFGAIGAFLGRKP